MHAQSWMTHEEDSNLLPLQAVKEGNGKLPDATAHIVCFSPSFWQPVSKQVKVTGKNESDVEMVQRAVLK